MASLEALKWHLRKNTIQPEQGWRELTEDEYRSGYEIMTQGPGAISYRDFITPQLRQILTPLAKLRPSLSVLEIGPGPRSVLAGLSDRVRQKIGSYIAFEPNELFAKSVEKWLSPEEGDDPLPALQTSHIHRLRFVSPEDDPFSMEDKLGDEKFDVILFCHSMYGMKPRSEVIKGALKLLDDRDDSIIVVFHRDKTLSLRGLVCHHTASYPTGSLSVTNSDDVLNRFAPFMMGKVPADIAQTENTLKAWRHVCRNFGSSDERNPRSLVFRSPEVMVTFTRHATALSELGDVLPTKTYIKNKQAIHHEPAAVLRPVKEVQIQNYVKWAITHKVGLSVIGGSHSDHCIWPNVVAVDMRNFQEIHVDSDSQGTQRIHGSYFPGEFLTVGGGCQVIDAIKQAKTLGSGIPMGTRPSVGAGSWLQGGIGHLTRLMGLSCDSIVGAVLVSPKNGDILCVGHVPEHRRPDGSIHLGGASELLWAIKGAGSNFGIIISVTFTLHPQMTFLTQYSSTECPDKMSAKIKLRDFVDSAKELQNNCSADAFLYWDTDRLHIGRALFEASASTFQNVVETPQWMSDITEYEVTPTIRPLDNVGLFANEAFMGGLQHVPENQKTSSFKRCVFLENPERERMTELLMSALEKRTTNKCYLHLMQGGGSASRNAEATAFGCRLWSYACIITGVWYSANDDAEIANATVQWVYDTVAALLPWSAGVYSADLGPDPRDQVLAAHAFGMNLPRLSRLKRALDPHNILRYSCQLSKPITKQKLVIFVTGDIAAGKDYCAHIWALAFEPYAHKRLEVKIFRISDDMKRQYARETHSNYNRLIWDRDYKEQHRARLTEFWKSRLHHRPELAKEYLLDIVYDNDNVDVLLITGLRDHAPVATYAPLAPDCRFIEVRVEASDETLRARRNSHADPEFEEDHLQHAPDLYFQNDKLGGAEAREFAKLHLINLVAKDLDVLQDMIQDIPDFPTPGLSFRHVLNIAQHPGGLKLCTALLRQKFPGSWAKVHGIVAMESGGFVFASPLAHNLEKPLILIREAEKLPPPKVSIEKAKSHISSVLPRGLHNDRIEISQNAIPKGAAVIIVDDTLASGETLCTTIKLLEKAGTPASQIAVLVVAEFPIHGGRELLRQQGFGDVYIGSLLVLNGK